MSRRALILAVTTASLGVTAVPALAAENCVGKRAGCHATLQAALDAAEDGDTITLEPGTFAGGVTVTKSVALAGAGQGATTVKGGGPVLTIGTLFDDSPPTVSIRDMTITGGRTTSSPQSVEFVGEEGVIALGGGIEIPPGHDFTPGADVTIARTTITDNRVAPTGTVALGPPCPGDERCPFAQAAGGGIDSWGTLTITDSTISGNRVGSASGISTLASDAEAGGIHSLIGSLTILRSRIDNNRATASAPNGRYADAGGVFAFDAPFTMRDSSISSNTANLAAGLPSSVEQEAHAGGLHLADSVPSATIARSAITNNSVGMTNTAGDAVVFSGGLHVDLFVDFQISDSVISGNRVNAETLGSSPGVAHGDGGGGQLFGRMERTRVFGNTVTAIAAAGDAEAMAGGSWVLFGEVSDSELRGNHLRATARDGLATVRGGGAVVDTAPELPDQGGLSLSNSSVASNIAIATGSTTLAHGGGIFDAVLPGGPFGGPLVLSATNVVHNVLGGGAGATLQGGGVYLAGASLTQSGGNVAHNVPDQCFGCGGSLVSQAAHARVHSTLRGRAYATRRPLPSPGFALSGTSPGTGP
jgi:hypothetical protein